MSRYENLSVGNLEVDRIVNSGRYRRTIYLDPTNGSDGNDGLAYDRAKATGPGCFGAQLAQTNKNDAILYIPGTTSLSLASELGWSYNMVHCVGLAPEAMMNQRSRIGMSTTFTPFITVSGYGNEFRNLYTMHGTAVGDYVGWLISGNRNAFHNVHFGGPMEAAQGGHASYVGVDITGTECYFNHCTFGTDTIGRDEVTPNVRLGPGTLTVFEDCTFLLNLTDGDPLFVKVLNTSGYTWANFKRCSFMAFNSNYAVAQTVAFKFTGGDSCAMVFDNQCTFQNVAALADAAEDQYIWLPRTFSTTTDTEAMRSVLLTI